MHPPQTLVGVLESLLTRDSILKSPLLSSLIILRNQISISSICELARLQSFNPTFDSIWTACSSSTQLQVLLSQWDPAFLILPFSIDPLVLQIRDHPRPLDSDALTRFISGISGTGKYRIARPNRSVPPRITFKSSGDLFAVWRALRIAHSMVFF
jgi:hypothetical protein